MLNGRKLLGGFLAHVSTLRSIEFVVSYRFACESWFKVEMVPVLVDMGIAQAQIRPGYAYPGTKDKGDLAIVAADESRTEVVFEFKHFVADADANKKQKFPAQVKRLANLVRQGVIDQGVTFMVFTYLNRSQPTEISSQPHKIISSSFSPEWVVSGLQPLLGFPMVTVAVATIPGFGEPVLNL